MLLGLLTLIGTATSASEALSSSSFTTNTGKKIAFTKHAGFGHFQSNENNNGKTTTTANGSSNGKVNNNGQQANGYANGQQANGNHDSLANGHSKKNGKKKNGSADPNSNNNFHDPVVAAEYVADTKLPTDVGQFQLRAYRVHRSDLDLDLENEDLTYQNTNALEPVVIYSSDKPPFGEDGRLAENVPVRIHDQCLTSEVFRSQRCDCKEQLKLALEFIQEHGGAVIYLQQEGRGIGLANKVAAYALQDMGMDTVDANLHLGFPEDCRKYGVVPTILKDMGIGSIQLMTNNPRKVER